MDMSKTAILGLSLALLLGCSAGKDAGPQAPRKTVFDPLIQQEQRARDVQKTVDSQARAQRRALDAEERGNASR